MVWTTTATGQRTERLSLTADPDGTAMAGSLSWSWLGIAALGLWLGGCETPVYGDDDTADDDSTGDDDDDTGDDDTGDDDTGDDDTGDDDTAYDDGDGDGWIASLDCDDSDPEVHPDAFDWCGDGIDQDCSGTADDDRVQLRPWELVAQPFSYAAPMVGDFRGLGRTDVALASYQLLIVMLHNDGVGGIDGITEIGGPGNTLSVLGGDFDGDGDPDLLAPVATGCPLSSYLNNGAGTFSVAGNVACGLTPSWGAVADFDGSGTADLVLVDPGAGTMQVLLGQGGLGFGAQAVVTPTVGAFEVQTADFDGDPWPDLVLSGSSGGVAALTGDGGGGFDEATVIGTGWSLEIGFAGDLDGDGLDDLLAVLADGDVMTARSEGGGSFAAPERHELPLPGLYATVADVTADGWGDVVVCAADGLSLLLNDGAGGLDESVLLAHDLGGTCRPTPVDLDGDGVDELLISAPAALGWYLLRTCPS
jgi:hypothetical protein